MHRAFPGLTPVIEHQWTVLFWVMLELEAETCLEGSLYKRVVLGQQDKRK